MSKKANANNTRPKPRRQARNNRLAPPTRRKTDPTYTHTYRFQSSATSDYDITADNLRGALGLLETSATVAYAITRAFRVKRVTVWSPPAAIGGVSHASITWTAEHGSGAIAQVSDVTMSVNHPAYVTASPPVGSQAFQWFSNPSTLILFGLHVHTGAIVDVVVESTLLDGTPLDTYTVTTGVIGTLSYAALNGIGGSLQPDGLNEAT
jgi:hypothetical protein